MIQMRSRYKGTCHSCKGTVWPGDSITFYRAGTHSFVDDQGDPITRSVVIHHDSDAGCHNLHRQRVNDSDLYAQEQELHEEPYSTLASDMTEREWQGLGPRLDERNDFHSIDDSYFDR